MRRALVRAPAFTLGRLIAGLALVTVAVPVAIYLWVAAHRLAYPYELDWLEGGTVELVGRAMHGQTLYGAPNLSYAGFTYTPLFFYLSAAIGEITGLAFLPLRIVSLGFSLIGFGALFLYVRHATRDAIAGLVAVGLFAAMYGLTGWFFDIGREDSMYLALSLLALWLGRRSESVAAGVLVGVVGFLAFFTKQVGLIAVAPALACAALARPRAGIAALGTLIVLGGASTLILDALTHGWYRFYIVSELAGQPSIQKAYAGFWRISLFHHLHWLTLLALLGLLLGAVLLGLRLRAAPSPRRASLWPVLRSPLLYDLAAALGLLVAAWVSFVHSGSYLNVLMPAYAACAGIGACAFAALSRRGLVGTLLATALIALQTVSLVRGEHPGRALPTRTDRAAGAQLERALRRLPGPVLVLRHPWYSTLAGKGNFAQADGLQEILRSKSSRGRTELRGALAGSLNRDGIQAVVLDARPAPAWLAPQLAKDFVVVPGTITRDRLRPVADLRSWPTYLFVRRKGH
jgi:hypothetical protein